MSCVSAPWSWSKAQTERLYRRSVCLFCQVQVKEKSIGTLTWLCHGVAAKTNWAWLLLCRFVEKGHSGTFLQIVQQYIIFHLDCYRDGFGVDGNFEKNWI